MKILQFITELGGGGAEKIVAMLSEELRNAGHEVLAISLLAPPGHGEDSLIAGRLDRAGVERVYLNARKIRFPFLAHELKKLFASFSPDLVHAHLIHANLLSRPICHALKIPLVNTIHTAEHRVWKAPYFLLDKWTAASACLTAVSEAAAQFHEKVCGLKRGSIRVIRNGIDPVRPASPERKQEVLTEILGNAAEWAEADVIAGSLGRLDAMKGFRALLDRLGPLSKKIPEGKRWLFLIFGDGPDRALLEEKAAHLPFSNIFVKFTGYRADAPSLLNWCDIFLSPSLCEGFGLAAAEAMTLGLPVVCNGIDALPELCRLYHGPSFLFHLMKDRTGEELAGKLLAAASSGRGKGQIIATRGAMTAGYLNVYSDLLKKNGCEAC